MDNSNFDDPNMTSEVAIIGMVGRFPGADDLDQFWRNLRDGVEAITFFSNEELRHHLKDLSVLADPKFVRAKGMLNGADLFDPAFFGFSHREAEIIDPQHRIFLECAWEALENAGYCANTFKGLIGIYAGASPSTYLIDVLSNSEIVNLVGTAHILFMNDRASLTNNVSYKLDLKGPSITVQAVCSTSLVSVHLACQSLLNGESDMALAGGVSINSQLGYRYQEGGIESPDGHCRAFDARAQGTVRGNGVGVVVLRRLSDAIRDGDYIHAVIKSSAVNNDGADKVGYAAPSVNGQAKVIAEAMALADIAPEAITYIEAHGTGTRMGDMIELASLTRAFGTSTTAKNYCAIGSVKTMIGHLDTAAGITGLIKTVLALQHKMIPPSLHFEKPNSETDIVNSPFYVNTKLSPWEAGDRPRCAGVNSFGIGGTNAHVILEEAPSHQPSGQSRLFQLLLLSAKTATALEESTKRLTQYLRQHPEFSLADVAYTLQVGRSTFTHRRIVLADGLTNAVGQLETPDSERVWTAIQEMHNRPIVFLFPGEEIEDINIGLEVYQSEASFREVIDQCSHNLRSALGLNLDEILYPSPQQMLWAKQQMRYPSINRLALFVIEYALAKLWMEWGVQPIAMVGYGVGEFVAACLAEVFSLEESLSLLLEHDSWMEMAPQKAIAETPLSNAQWKTATSHEVHSTSEAQASAEAPLEIQTPELLKCCALQARWLNGRKFKAPKIPFISGASGAWVSKEEATDSHYWAKRWYSTGTDSSFKLDQIFKRDEQIFLEVGPRRSSASASSRYLTGNSILQEIFFSLSTTEDQVSDLEYLLTTLGKLWLDGVTIDWDGFYTHEHRRRLPLPTYPFDRRSYRVERQARVDGPHPDRVSLAKSPDIADWLYVPSWRRSHRPGTFKSGNLAQKSRSWLIFADKCGLGSTLAKRLEQEQQHVVTVTPGDEYRKIGGQNYTINPYKQAHYETLFKELYINGKGPESIAHCWMVTPPGFTPSKPDLFEEFQYLGFYSLIFLAKSLSKQTLSQPLQLTVLSNNVQDVLGDECLIPDKSTLLGPCRVIPQEYAYITCRSIDLALSCWIQNGEAEVLDLEAIQQATLIDQLLADIAETPSELFVAYRGRNRWIQDFEPLGLSASTTGEKRLRTQGVYLITGGLGRIGLTFARYLAQTVRAKLVLLGRSFFPEREDWEEWLASHSEEDGITRKIRTLKEIEQIGAEVLVINADVASEEEMNEVMRRVHQSFGTLHGVIHAAGAAGIQTFNSIKAVTEDQCERQFQAKVRGVLALERVLKGLDIDFCVLLSSLSSFLGGLGFCTYSAANTFMDSVVHRHTRAGNKVWMSVNWDAWQFGKGGELKVDSELGLTPQEGTDVLDRLLALGPVSQVIVSTGNFQVRIEKWIRLQTPLNTVLPKNVGLSLKHPRPELRSGYVAPRNELEQTIAELWGDMLGLSQIGVHDSFFDLGGHSLFALQFIQQLHSRFQVQLSVQVFFSKPTVAQIAEWVRRAQAEDRHSVVTPLVPIQLGGSKRPFYCVHSDGGGVLMYFDLARHLGQSRPFYGLQALELDQSDQSYRRMEEIAAVYIKAIRDFQTEGPYLLGGYSFGALVAFEMARQLKEQDQVVSLLALIDSRVIAHSGRKEPVEIHDPQLLASLARELVLHLGKARPVWPFTFKEFCHLTPDDRVFCAFEQLRVAGVFSRDNDLPLFQRFLHGVANRWEAVRTYRPQFYPGPITLFRSNTINSVSADLVSNEVLMSIDDATLGWGSLSPEPIRVTVIPGEHNFLIAEPYVQILAEHLKASIEEAEKETI